MMAACPWQAGAGLLHSSLSPTMNHPLTPADYLTKILTARVYDVAVESDLEPAKALSRRLHNKVLLKREDQQPVFSFKLRGAYNKMAHLSPEQLQKGVICASAGNHAQGVALGARKLGCRAVIVMPTTTPQVKIDAVQALGGEVVLAGESYSDAYKHSVKLQKDQGLTFVHPFDDPYVIAGQGTIAMEMLSQLQKLGSPNLDAVFVAIGGGGLISGVANYIKAVDTRSIVEPSGALAVAAIKQYVARNKTKGETYAAILCGANMNFDRLRFVAERAEVGEEREALFAVTIPEERGSFRRFCEVVGKLPGGQRNVTEFNYRISHHGSTRRVREDRQELREARLRGTGPDLRRHGQGASAPHGRRPLPSGAGGASAALRVPRAARRAVQVPEPDGTDLEHLAVPLPQPGCRLRPHPGRHAGAGQGWQEIRRLPEQPRLPLGRGNRQSGLSALPEVTAPAGRH
jgi:threonine dehydratase